MADKCPKCRLPFIPGKRVLLTDLPPGDCDAVLPEGDFCAGTDTEPCLLRQLADAKTALATAKADALTGAADYFETEGDRHAHKNRYPWDWAAKMLRRRADEAQQAQQGEKGGA